MSAVNPFPYYAVYGATKKFNDQLAKSLSMEFKGRIDFLALKPNFVATNMVKTQPSGFVINVEDCVEGCLRDVGWQGETAGHWKHDICEWFIMNVATKNMKAKTSIETLAASENTKEMEIKV